MSDTADEQQPQQPLRVVNLQHLRRPPTVTEFAWGVATGMAFTIAGLVVAGYLAAMAWNNLTEMTGLPEAGFTQGLSAAVLLYLLRVLAR